MRKNIKSKIASSLGLAAAVSILAGCQTYSDQTKAIQSALSNADTAKAQALTTEYAEKSKDSVDALVFNLEKGATSRANGDIRTSATTFESVRKTFKKIDSLPETSLTEEFYTILTNPTYSEYKGYNYDRIMVGIYQSMNRLEEKNMELARIELNRLRDYQDKSASINSERIKKEERALDAALKKEREKAFAARKNSEKQVAKTASAATTASAPAAASSTTTEKKYDIYTDYLKLLTPKVKEKLVKCSNNFDGSKKVSGNAAIASKRLYVNPFGYYLCGIFNANCFNETSDIERASTYFRFANEMCGGKSALIQSDLQMTDDMANGKKVAPVTYVVFETGLAPSKDQIRIDLPVGIFFHDIPLVSAAFPYLVKHDDFSPDLNLKANGQKQNFETVADMDEIISEEFDNEYPMLVTKTLLSTLVKAGIQYGIAQTSKGNDYLYLATQIGTGLYTAAMNEADLREWASLPKQIKITRFVTPSDASVEIEGVKYKVAADTGNIIFVRKASKLAKPSVRVLQLAGHSLLSKGASQKPAAETPKSATSKSVANL